MNLNITENVFNKVGFIKLAFLCALSLPTTGISAEVEFNFTFEKKPPSSVVVYAVDGSSDAISELKIDQKDKKFDLPVYVKTKASKLSFHNSDTMDHNIYSKKKGTWDGLDIGLLKPQASLESDAAFPDGAMVRLGCKIHPKMRAYVATVPNKYFLAQQFDKKSTTSSIKLTIPNDATKVGLLMPGYDVIETTIDTTSPIELIKKGKTKGNVTISKL